MSDVLTGATNHFNFRELPGGKIILTEEAYTRLSGAINLCALSGKEEKEYGTFLYGNEIENNVILFDKPSEFDDYEPTTREFNVNTDSNGNELGMHKELIINSEGDKYNCIAHIHTHPYIGGTCRFFSNQDLSMVRSLQSNFQPSSGKKKYFFGGLLTVGVDNKPESDEISFVFYDDNYGWYKITNIYVLRDKELVPFSKVNNRPQMSI